MKALISCWNVRYPWHPAGPLPTGHIAETKRACWAYIVVRLAILSSGYGEPIQRITPRIAVSLYNERHCICPDTAARAIKLAPPPLTGVSSVADPSVFSGVSCPRLTVLPSTSSSCDIFLNESNIIIKNTRIHINVLRRAEVTLPVYAYRNETLEALAASEIQEFDDEARKAIVCDMQAALAEDAPTITLLYATSYDAWRISIYDG
jgi:hypothetical protein